MRVTSPAFLHLRGHLDPSLYITPQKHTSLFLSQEIISNNFIYQFIDSFSDKMMNVFALALVLATLLAASVHSPAPPVKNQEDVIVKEGHRVVKVEFDEDGVGNTKVSISSNDQASGHFGTSVKDKISGAVGDAKEKLKESTSTMPNLGQGIGYQDENGGTGEGYGERASARELVCNAFGKCTHKIANAFGKTKGVVSDKAQEAADKMYEVEEDAKETANGAMGRVKDSVADKANQASDLAKDAATKTKSSVEEAAGKVKDSVTKNVKQATNMAGDAAINTKSSLESVAETAKDSVTQKATKASDLAGDAARNTKSRMAGVAEMTKDSVTEKAKQASDLAGDVAKNTKSRIVGGAEEAVEMTRKGVKETADMAKTLAGDVRRNASEKMENIAEKVKHGAEKVEGEGKKQMEKIRSRGSGLWHFIFDSLRSYMRILQLIGVATAYGMSMWVTFLSSYVLASVLPRQQFANAQSKIYPIYFKAMAYSVGLALLGHLFSEGKFQQFASLENFQALNLLSSLGMILANLLHFEPRAAKVMFERLKWEKEEGRGLHGTPPATTTMTSKAAEPSNVRLVDSVVSPSNMRSVDSALPPTDRTTEATETTGITATGNGASEARPLKIVELSETLKKLNSVSSFLNVITLMGLTLHLVHLGQRLGTAC